MSRNRGVLYLPVQLLIPRPAGDVRDLTAAVRREGILQPLTVRAAGDRYAVISGRRRLQAARSAGLEQVPCLEALPGETDPALTELRERLHREDVPFDREAALLRAYIRRSGMTQAQAAKGLGRSQSWVANKLRLLELGPEMTERIRRGGLTERHGRALLRLPGRESRQAAAELMIAEKMTVAAAETYIGRLLEARDENRGTQRPRGGHS